MDWQQAAQQLGKLSENESIILAAATLLAVFSYSEIGKIIGKLLQFISSYWLSLSSGLGIDSNVRPWGGVFESDLNSAIAGATVSLYQVANGERHLVGRQQTGLNGQYGFPISPGSYQIEVSKIGYVFPTQSVSSAYAGTTFSITSQQVINLNLYVDPIGRTGTQSVAEKFQSLLLVIGSGVMLFGLIQFMSPLAVVVAIVYAGIWVEKIVQLKRGVRGRY